MTSRKTLCNNLSCHLSRQCGKLPQSLSILKVHLIAVIVVNMASLLAQAYPEQVSRYDGLNSYDQFYDSKLLFDDDFRAAKSVEEEEKSSSNSQPQVGDIDKSNPSTIVNSELDRVYKNAVNAFAQQVGRNIFHITPQSQKLESSSLPRTVVWSPFSVHQALEPLFYAADGETKQELWQLLWAQGGYVVNRDNPEKSTMNGVTNERSSLISTTGIFTRNDVTLNPEFINKLPERVKNVNIKTVNFDQSVNAAKEINSWARQNTHGLIENAVDEAQVDPNTFMMIVNCVHFKSAWKTQFAPELTKLSNFYGLSGPKSVQMMKQVGAQRFAKFPVNSSYGKFSKKVVKQIPAFSLVEIPYADNDLVSLFILPETTDQMQATLEYVSNIEIGEIRQKMDIWDMEIIMPKFRVSSDVHLEDALIESGLKTLFDARRSNLSKLFVKTEDTKIAERLAPSPYLSNIVHRTVFETTEEGTSAAALTALSIVPLSALPKDRVIRFNLNRPFIVLLVKESDNTLVFQGLITDLTEQDLGQVSNPNENVSGGAKDVPSPNSQTNLTGDGIYPVADNTKGAWWIPKKIPAYLLPDTFTTLEDNANFKEPAKAGVNDVIKPTHKEETSSEPSKLPIELIQFTKYQQPEPIDPYGIRFPATIPINRNKLNIKPRFDNADHAKNLILRWMNIY